MRTANDLMLVCIKALESSDCGYTLTGQRAWGRDLCQVTFHTGDQYVRLTAGAVDRQFVDEGDLYPLPGWKP
jgi:hypothetical protein